MTEKMSPYGLGERESPLDMQHTMDDLLHWIDLKPIGANKWRANNPWPTSRYNIFGGVTVAQCVKAAYLSVRDGLAIHSMHGYFTSPGKVDQPTDLHIYMKRDGKSSAYRQIFAMQGDDVILSLSTSFSVPKDGVEADLTLMTGVAHPETLKPASPYGAMATSLGIFDTRLASPEIEHDFQMGTTLPSRLWFKSHVPLPDDPVVHACILAFTSDISTGIGDTYLRITPTSGGPSLDHVAWFHKPMRMDEWFYLDQVAVRLASGRALYRGSMHDIQGRTCVTLAQELLAREVPHENPNIPTTIEPR